MPGVRLLEYNGLSFIVFEPSQLGLYFSEMNSSGQLTRSKADEVLAMPGVLAVLDGPMFHDCSSVGRCTIPPRHQCSAGNCNAVILDYLYLDRRAGESFEGRYPGRGMTLSVREDGRVYAAHGASSAGDPVVAVQLYPELIWDGQNASSPNIDTSVTWRAALGVLGGKLIIATARGSMHNFAEKLRALGVTYAGYTDGGGSAALGLRSGERVGSTEDRAVASWIVVREPATLGMVSPLAFLDRITHGATGLGLFGVL
jgi:hypothetical protein